MYATAPELLVIRLKSAEILSDGPRSFYYLYHRVPLLSGSLFSSLSHHQIITSYHFVPSQLYSSQDIT
jgi:hypothetical protein